MKKSFVATVISLGLLTGCMGPISPFGPSTYLYSASASKFSSQARVLAKANVAANEFCALRGLVYLPKNYQTQPGRGPGLAHGPGVQLIFRCVQSTDRENSRHDWRQEAF